MSASGFTRDPPVGRSGHHIFGGGEIAKGRFPVIQGMITEKWQKIAEKDEAKYLVSCDVCGIR